MRRLLRLFLVVASTVFATAALVDAAERGSGESATLPVTLSDSTSAFTLSNGFVSAKIDKQTGNLSGLQYHGLDLLKQGRGYWSQVARGGRGLGTERSVAVIQDPAKNGGNVGEVSVQFRYDLRTSALPVDVEMRYAVTQEGSGVYASTIWRHRPEYPAFGVAEARYALKLNPQVFDFLTVDSQRQRQMPTGQDWDRGVDAGIKEARRLTSGQYAGMVEHKYDYSAVLSETPAYGWSSSKHKVGVWIVNPSMEYIAGGPTKVELTGHLDVNAGGAPTLLNMWNRKAAIRIRS